MANAGRLISIGGRLGAVGQRSNSISLEKKNFEHCVSRVVTHYPVEVRLMASAKCMGGPRAPKPQRCSAGCSVYWQYVLEGSGNEIEYHPQTIISGTGLV
ncbi:hypothetical protein TNCV_1449141 [Trichonephila clavipes]|nr:hypothetical protein TNCV_1449141 [Trichonephila clavipes]